MSLRPSQKEHFQSINPQKDQFPSLSGLTNCSLPTPEKEVEGCWSPFRIIAQPCPFSSWSTSELRNCKSFYKSSQVVLASIHQGWLQKKGYLFPRKLARNKRLHSLLTRTDCCCLESRPLSIGHCALFSLAMKTGLYTSWLIWKTVIPLFFSTSLYFPIYFS